MIFRGRRGKRRPMAIGSRVQRRDRLPFTKCGTVLAIIEPRSSFDAVTRAQVRWDDAEHSIELWPVAFLVVNEQAGSV